MNKMCIKKDGSSLHNKGKEPRLGPTSFGNACTIICGQFYGYFPILQRHLGINYRLLNVTNNSIWYFIQQKRMHC